MNTPTQILAATLSAKHEAPLVMGYPKHGDLDFVCAESRQIDNVWNWRSSPHIGSQNNEILTIFGDIESFYKCIHQSLGYQTPEDVKR